MQDQIWNRVTINRAEKKSTRYYMDEFHLLLKEEQTAAYSVESIGEGVLENGEVNRHSPYNLANGDCVCRLNRSRKERLRISAEKKTGKVLQS